MPDWMLRALGADADDVEAVTGWSLRWQTETWGPLAAGLLVLLALFAWWLYRRSPQEVNRGRRTMLTMLRVAFLAVLCALLLQPVLRLTFDEETPRSLPVLIDATGSMAMRDGPGGTRMQDVQAAFSDVRVQSAFESLDDLKVPLLSFRGTEELTLVEGPEAIVPGGDETALGDALERVHRRHRRGSVAGVVVITDGGQNAGRSIGEVAESLRRAGIPIFAVGVGDAEAKDVAIESLDVRDVLLADDAAPVRVRLSSQGMAGRGGRLVFTLGGVEVAEEEVRFEADGPLEVETLLLPKRPGEYPLEVRFEPEDAGEVLADNNQVDTTVRVVDRRLRVLLVDQAPRWEYKYLEAMLLRERRVDLSCFLFEADPEVARVPGSPHVERFPSRPEDLFDFDLVILGDIDPGYLNDARQALLRDYVSRAGGALVVVAGKRHVPAGYGGSELARLLPVALAGSTLAGRDSNASRPVRLELTTLGAASMMLRLGDDPEASAARWKRLPPIYWTAPVLGAKPAAEVYLTRPAPEGGDGRPVVVLHRYGAGEVLFVGTDNFWRWRRNVGDRDHATLWGQIIQRMAGSRLLMDSPRVRLQADRRSYRPGDRVSVYARAFNRAWDPRGESVLPAVVMPRSDSTRRRELAMQAVPGQPGLFRVEFTAGEAGDYRLALSGDEVTTLDFLIRNDSKERSRAAMNDGLLRELAEQTGGAFLTLDELSDLPALLPERTVTVPRIEEVDLWTSPLVFGLLLLLITAEWILRKYSELK